MNRDEKAAVIEQIAAEITEANAVLAVDYRGISVGQAAELRGKLRESGASFRVVKNSLTERAADQVGAESLKALLAGPTALTFVNGDVALAAKAIADQARATQLLPFKGGIMDGAPVTPEEVASIARLPARDVLYGQLVGLVSSPIGGLVRTLNALISGVAVQLGGVLAKKQSGELPAGEPAHEATPPSSDAEPAQGADSGTDAPASTASHESGEATAPAEGAAETAAEAPAVEAAETGSAAESGAPAAQAVPAEGKDSSPVQEPVPAEEPVAAQEPAPGEEPVPAEAAEPPAEEALAQDAAPVAEEQKQADPEPAAPAENDNQTDASADPVEAKEDQ